MILNLTQHSASPEQLSAGVVDLSPWVTDIVRSLLTVPAADLLAPDAHAKLAVRARGLRLVLDNEDDSMGCEVMIGGLPALMHHLVHDLYNHRYRPLYAVSDRVSRDGPDGTKVSVFAHLGFIAARG